MKSVHQLKVVAALTAVCAFSAAGFAEDAEQTNPDTKALLEYVKKLESRVNTLESEREWPLEQVRRASDSALEGALRSVNLKGFMEFQANYNYRHGGAGNAPLAVSPGVPVAGGTRGDTLNFNRGHGTSNDETSFSFQTVQLLADKPLTTENSTGFRVRAEFGEVSRFDNRDFNFTDPTHAFDVREAFMSWRAGMGWGLTNYIDLSIGKMDSPLGLETPDAIDDDNYGLVTRNPIHVFATPVTHTGIRAVFPWMECAKTSVWVVNGWDNVRDADGDGKTLIVSHEMGKYEWMNSSIMLNFSFGNEGSIYPNAITTGVAPDGNKTKLGEFIWRGELSSDTRVALDVFWATADKNRVEPDGDIRTRNFHGGAAYLRHQLQGDTWIAGRLGWYADDAVFSGDNTDLRVADASVTVGCEVAQDLSVALEYRHDRALTGRPFLGQDADQTKRTQHTLTASFVYRF